MQEVIYHRWLLALTIYKKSLQRLKVSDAQDRNVSESAHSATLYLYSLILALLLMRVLLKHLLVQYYTMLK